jgi:hypothetical protein
MREKLKPMLFDDEYVEQARATRASPVAKARRSDQAKAKDASECEWPATMVQRRTARLRPGQPMSLN